MDQPRDQRDTRCPLNGPRLFLRQAAIVWLCHIFFILKISDSGIYRGFYTPLHLKRCTPTCEGLQPAAPRGAQQRLQHNTLHHVGLPSTALNKCEISNMIWNPDADLIRQTLPDRLDPGRPDQSNSTRRAKNPPTSPLYCTGSIRFDSLDVSQTPITGSHKPATLHTGTA